MASAGAPDFPSPRCTTEKMPLQPPSIQLASTTSYVFGNLEPYQVHSAGDAGVVGTDKPFKRCRHVWFVGPFHGARYQQKVPFHGGLIYGGRGNNVGGVAQSPTVETVAVYENSPRSLNCRTSFTFARGGDCRSFPTESSIEEDFDRIPCRGGCRRSPVSVPGRV